MPGKSIEPDDHDLPGKEIPYKGFVKLVTAIKCISPKGINLPEEWGTDDSIFRLY